LKLSGGQKQLMNVTRGLLACHDKDILLLDEPTSALDPTTSVNVYQNVFREFAGKTVIASVHQFELLRFFDEICFFQDGKLLASGTFSELMESCPAFRDMATAPKEIGEGSAV